jgi:uncharacterized protein with HEPN domain
MHRDYRVYLDDVAEAASRIRRYVPDLAALEDQKTLDAVIRNLEIIGEAVKKVPDEVRASYPEIDWRRISGLRDILIHQYFGIDLDIIRDIVLHKVPQLEEAVRGILGGTEER